MQRSWHPFIARSVGLILAIGVNIGSLWADDAIPAQPRRVATKSDVVYGDVSEPMHRADLFFPSKRDVGTKLPGVLMIHGGAWTAGDKSYDRVHARSLAARGYWVMVVNYRLAPTHRFPAQLEDCRRALRWMMDHAHENDVDVERLGAWGYSAGGHLSALLSLQPDENGPKLKACVSGGTPFDLTTLPPETPALSGVFGGTPKQMPQVYERASPVTHVTKGAPPMFLFHGTKDWLVPVKSSLSMIDRLKTCQVEYEYYQVEGKGHLATFADTEAMEASFSFLDECLKSDSTWRIEPNQSK
jgi:acetyl esterase/lipase